LKSPDTPRQRLVESEDDISSEGGASVSRKKLRKEDDTSGGDEEDKIQKRRQQIAAASRASRARRKRELEDLRTETRELRDERDILQVRIQNMQKKLDESQQRPILLTETRPKKKATDPSFPNVLIEIDSYSPAIKSLMTGIRDRDCSPSNYVQYSDRLCRILAEEGLARCNLVREQRVTTPTESELLGLAYPDFEKDCCVVSIMRSGDILADAIREIVPTIPVGKILIQRREDTANKVAQFHWAKFPHDIKKRFVFVCDPMLGTGGSIVTCMNELVKEGVSPQNVLFLNIVSCPEGLSRLERDYPDVSVITCAIDTGLNDKCYIIPGLGDYGDRYYHT